MKKFCSLLAAVTLLCGCSDDLGILNNTSQNEPFDVLFTASIAKQDFFGVGNGTRSALTEDERERVQSGFYDLPVNGMNDAILSVSTLDGIFGKSVPMPEEGSVQSLTRGVLLSELQQEPMYVMESGTDKNGKTVHGEQYKVMTSDGTSWGGKFVSLDGNMVSDVLRALYPARENAQFTSDGLGVTYWTPAKADEQCDLLFAQHQSTLGHTLEDSLHLNFNHILTAVRFKIGSQQLPLSVIKSITISGIATKGTFACDSRTWTVASDKDSVSCYLDYNASGCENVIVNGGENTFMLLPQQLTSDAKVTIYYQDQTSDSTATVINGAITASLSPSGTKRWEPGQCITYTLMNGSEKSQYIIEVEAPQEFSPEGGTQTVSVVSYTYEDGVRTPKPWSVQEYSGDGGRSWLKGGYTNVPKGLAVSPNMGTDGTLVNVTLLPADTVMEEHGYFMRYKTPLGYGEEGVFDLSTHDYLNNPCAQTTANCYVVDAPGKYRFPTAYGNSIVNGKTNQKAYDPLANSLSSIVLSGFPDYSGKQITAPMIANNGTTLSRATLVWEDVENLIDSISLVNGGSAVEFYISPETIDQGNAVIAVLDGSGNIVWSWHIWVTDQKASLAQPIEVQNKYGEQVGFMPLTLGWCSTSNAYGAMGRDLAVRITMSDLKLLGNRCTFRIRQNSSETVDLSNNMEGNAPYYNWGRKDPFPGAKSTAQSLGDYFEDMSCQPKDFYQAGLDAATFGLHAELHVTYTSDFWSLFGAGAFTAFRGFMTGMMIGSIYNTIHEAAEVAATEVGTVTVEEAQILEEAQFGLVDAGTSVSQALTREGIQNALGGSLISTSTQKVGTAIQYVGEVTIKNFGTITNAYAAPILQNGKVIAYAIVGEGTWQGMTGLFMFPASAVARTAASKVVLSIGAFSRVVMESAVGVALNADPGFWDVLSASSFWEGGTSWCREVSSHGVTLSEAIRHPYVLYRDPISWTGRYTHLWNAGTPGPDDPNKAVVKSVYDPCPAGYCVPSARDFSNITDKNTMYGSCGSTYVSTENEDGIVFPGLGLRNFWDGVEPGAEATNNINEQIFHVGDQGFYWTSSPAVNKDDDTETGAYAVNMRADESYDKYGNNDVRYTPRVINNLKLQQSYALPVRPVREK